MPANPVQGGFLPYMKGNENAGVKFIRRRIASNNGTAIFKYDCMKVTAAGVWGLATAGSGVTGVSGGASYWDATINGRRENAYLPASTTYSSTAFDQYGETDQSFCYITDDAIHTEFRCQYSGTAVVALTDLTKNANFVATAGSTATGLSGHELNSATIATTAALDFNIVDFWHSVQNDPTAVDPKVIVRINLGVSPPFNANGTAGV